MSSNNAARLAEIDRALDQLLDAEPEERRGLLAELAERDPELAREVAELLEHAVAPEATAAGWLAGPLWRQIDASLPDPEAAAPGERLGAWRIVSEIGRGGMAVVYLAERADGAFAQRAAIKLLQAGGGGLEAIRRFEQERQILASLKHPAIARLLDGGVDQRGRPFLVLEYVEGEPIDAYCDRHRLPLDRRLDLFAQVARAVDFAHRSLVIHRDLKPSNILVEEDGAVKLLDFGIAKLLDAEVAGEHAAPPTRTLLRAMTPEYASPEQVRGLPVTTASDVYQLGLLLYELLTGERAYRVPTGSAGAIEQAICTTEPRRPSTAVRQAAAAAAARHTASRSTSVAALSRRLAGDLDTILLTALAKEPERRYGSAKELLDDLERHREGRPVRARQPTWGYRMGKLVRRHRWGVAAAAGLTLLLVGYAVTVTVQAAQIARERDRARAEAKKSQEVKELLADLLEHAGPEVARGREVTVREVLDQASQRLERQLGDQPEIQAEMLATVGEMYSQLGLYPAAAPLLEQAVANARALGPAGRPLLAASLLRQARLRRRQGDLAAAELLLREALALDRTLHGSGHPAVAEVLVELAITLQRAGRLAEATDLFRQALALRERLPGRERAEVAESLSLLAGHLRLVGSLAEAAELHRRSLALRRRLPADDPNLAATLNDLALTLIAQGEPRAAEPLLREALAIEEKIFGTDHPRVAVTASNLAEALWRNGSFAAAEPLVRRALAIRQARFPARHPAVATNYSFLGRVLQDKGDLAGARLYYRKALDLFAPEAPQQPSVLFNLGTVLEAEHRYAEAERLYREVLAIQRRQLGEDHPTVGLDLLVLGNVRLAQGDRTGAEPLLGRALDIFRRQLPAAHPYVARALLPLGRLRLAEGRPAAALPLFAEALAIRRQRYGEADPRTAEARADWSRAVALAGPPLRSSRPRRRGGRGSGTRAAAGRRRIGPKPRSTA